MNVISYPLHLCRKFERRWTAKAVQDETQRSPSQRPNGCTACGRIVTAPLHATYLPTGNLVNQWRCPVCRNSWQTSADAASSTDIQLSRSEHLRDNAGHDAAPNDAAREQFRSMGDFALARILGMTDKRNRWADDSLAERLAADTLRLREEASHLEPGAERDALLTKHTATRWLPISTPV